MTSRLAKRLCGSRPADDGAADRHTSVPSVWISVHLTLFQPGEAGVQASRDDNDVSCRKERRPGQCSSNVISAPVAFFHQDTIFDRLPSDPSLDVTGDTHKVGRNDEFPLNMNPRPSTFCLHLLQGEASSCRDIMAPNVAVSSSEHDLPKGTGCMIATKNHSRILYDNLATRCASSNV